MKGNELYFHIIRNTVIQVQKGEATASHLGILQVALNKMPMPLSKVL